MLSQRLVRAINLSIAVLLVAGLVGAYWFVWRALPPVSGRIGAPISAEEPSFATPWAYLTFRPRAGKTRFFFKGTRPREIAYGRWTRCAERLRASSEIVGKGALESDQEARRLRLARIAEASLPSMNDAARTTLAAYARGVNYYIETHRGRLPLEFTLLNYSPRPWSIRDSVLAGL